METDIYKMFKELQFKSWWFNGRRKVIESFMKSNVHDHNLKILDIGSGYGGLLPVLTNFGSVDVIEPYEQAHADLFKLGAQNIYKIADFPASYPKKKYDMVTLFDVLEHIENDVLCLKVVKEDLLESKGMCFITVPAYMWMWGSIDEMGGHLRRYVKKSLLKIMLEAGFHNIRISYFQNLLFPYELMLEASLKLKLRKLDIEKIAVDYPLNPMINKILESIFSFESRLIPRINFQWGTSLIAKGEV